MAFINPMQAAGPVARSAWGALIGTNIPKWVYPAFGIAAGAPIVGYELDKAREAAERRKAQAAASAVKAAFAVAAALQPPDALPPGSQGNLQRLDRLGHALRAAKHRSYHPSPNKPKSTFRQEADTVSTDADPVEPAQIDKTEFAAS